MKYIDIFTEENKKIYSSLLEQIQNDIKVFHGNLYCIKKIIPFVKNKIPYSGINAMDLTFLQLFIYNSIQTMVLLTNKLFFDKPNLKKGTNCGFPYLKQFLYNNCKEDFRSQINKYINNTSYKNGIKRINQLEKKLTDIRNKSIAHYDLDYLKIKREGSLKTNIEELEKIYIVLVESFTILSLDYYQQKYGKVIEYNGVESVLKLMAYNNPNPLYETDIEKILNSIGTSALQIKIENVKV
ncbi:hypothetical protein [Bacillus sp. NPDC094106]|uniref:hypothetical protein n=1 Tax=Bacillus sp. NPDC094106 TaxID=3363949 RepID=UPI0038306273